MGKKGRQRGWQNHDVSGPRRRCAPSQREAMPWFTEGPTARRPGHRAGPNGAPSPCGQRRRRTSRRRGWRRFGHAGLAPRSRTHAFAHARRAGNHFHAHAHAKAHRISRPIGSWPSAVCPAEGRASTAPVAPESPMPRTLQHTFILLTWMAAGQAQQSGSVARDRQFEPARFESAPPFSLFIMKHFQDAQVTSFRENFSIRITGICCVLRAACMFRDTARSIHCRIDCWKE